MLCYVLYIVRRAVNVNQKVKLAEKERGTRPLTILQERCRRSRIKLSIRDRHKGQPVPSRPRKQSQAGPVLESALARE